jgi:hypothetical protein
MQSDCETEILRQSGYVPDRVPITPESEKKHIFPIDISILE